MLPARTPLARKLIALVAASGPLTVNDYMDACLNDPDHGYYRTRAAIGRAGDFITAPEISQVFGELLGLWCAVVWQQMGSPGRFNLVELGAGRGTLMADALRATRLVPGFRDGVTVRIVDSNPPLVEMQRAALARSGASISWHTTLDDVPAGAPSIWLANEFLDTIPLHQYVRRDGRWVSRAIGLDAQGGLAFVPAPPVWHVFDDTELPPHPVARAWAEGDIYESQSWDGGVLNAMRSHARAQPLAALFIDYGYVGGAAIDTLQAVRAHRPDDVLGSPGEADLSCQVDFDCFAHAAGHPGPMETALIIDGPVTQAEFLGQLGIMERASRLMAANPAQANTLEMGIARLMAPQGMGTRFKAIGLRTTGLPPLPGLTAHS